MLVAKLNLLENVFVHCIFMGLENRLLFVSQRTYRQLVEAFARPKLGCFETLINHNDVELSVYCLLLNSLLISLFASLLHHIFRFSLTIFRIVNRLINTLKVDRYSYRLCSRNNFL